MEQSVSVVWIEQDLAFLKTAEHILDLGLGLGGGVRAGELVAQG